MDPPLGPGSGERPWYPSRSRPAKLDRASPSSGYASTVSDRAFARPGSEAPWQPICGRPGRLATRAIRAGHARWTPGDGRLAVDGLEALQARAVADPGWFWGAAVDDIGIDWQRRPTTVLDLAGGPAWARWWTGGAFNYALAAIEPWAAARPGRGGARLGGRGRRGPDADRARAGRGGRAGPPGGSPRRASARRSGRDPAADAPRDGRRRARARPAPGDLHADLQRLRRAGDRGPAARLRGDRPDHRRRVPAARRDGSRSRRSPTRRSPRRRRSGRSSSCAGSAGARSTCRWTRPGRRWSREPTPPRSAAAGPTAAAADRPPTDPETPYMLIYTSGTTGRPKGAVHVHGGFPIKAAQDLAHTFDLRPRRRACSGSPTSAG